MTLKLVVVVSNCNSVIIWSLAEGDSVEERCNKGYVREQFEGVEVASGEDKQWTPTCWFTSLMDIMRKQVDIVFKLHECAWGSLCVEIGPKFRRGSCFRCDRQRSMSNIRK